MNSDEKISLESRLDLIQTERLLIEVHIDELREQRDVYLNEEDEIGKKLENTEGEQK